MVGGISYQDIELRLLPSSFFSEERRMAIQALRRISDVSKRTGQSRTSYKITATLH